MFSDGSKLEWSVGQVIALYQSLSKGSCNFSDVNFGLTRECLSVLDKVIYFYKYYIPNGSYLELIRVVFTDDKTDCLDPFQRTSDFDCFEFSIIRHTKWSYDSELRGCSVSFRAPLGHCWSNDIGHNHCMMIGTFN